MTTMKVGSSVRVNAFLVIAEAVDRGINWGWQHAHKHVEDPGETAIKESLYNDIMNELCEVLRFDDGANA